MITDKKTQRKIRKLKPTEELTITLNDIDETVDIICLEKEQYLVFTSDTFYELNYDELLHKYL